MNLASLTSPDWNQVIQWLQDLDIKRKHMAA